MRDFKIDDKCYVRFSISNYGKTYQFDGEFDEEVVWPEVLHEIVKTLEASYGYSFDIDVETPQGLIGVYHASKP
jgi:hypothetical protein